MVSGTAFFPFAGTTFPRMREFMLSLSLRYFVHIWRKRRRVMGSRFRGNDVSGRRRPKNPAAAGLVAISKYYFAKAQACYGFPLSRERRVRLLQAKKNPAAAGLVAISKDYC
jgi:hypothetical protein